MSIYELRYADTKDFSQWSFIRSPLDTNWNNPNEICVELADTGNELILKCHTKKKIKLEYHEVCEFKILLDQYFKHKLESKLKYTTYIKEE